MGFRLETVRRNGVTNLWARRGNARPLVCLAGHTDVVPSGPRDQWRSDPFTPTVRDGVLYGRGASDMKTSIAAFVTASEDFLSAHPNSVGSIAFCLTSDEEGPSVDGTRLMVENRAGRTLTGLTLSLPYAARSATLNGQVLAIGRDRQVILPTLAPGAQAVVLVQR